MQLTSSKPSLAEMIRDLQTIPEVVWGQQLFQRDILYNRLSEEEQREMIIESIRCGNQTAMKLQKKYGSLSLEEILKEEKLLLSYQKEEQIGSRILLALYQSPNEIILMEDSIQKMKSRTDIPENIRNSLVLVILGHELFHHIECNDPEIYTQKKQVKLWQFLFYKHYSTVRTTSEIAAMCFSKRLNQIPFPPFILDLLLVYLYDENQALEFYQEMLVLNADYQNRK